MIAVAAGEHLGVGTGLALGAIVVGIVLAARAPAVGEQPEHSDPRAALCSRSARRLAFGASLYATGRASLDLPIAWAVLPPRVVGVALVTIPLVLAGRLRVTRTALP